MDVGAQRHASSREELIAAANTKEALAASEALRGFLEMCDNQDIAPSAGLTVTDHSITSQPDGNTIKIQFIRTVLCFYGKN